MTARSNPPSHPPPHGPTDYPARTRRRVLEIELRREGYVITEVSPLERGRYERMANAERRRLAGALSGPEATRGPADDADSAKGAA